MEQRLSHQVEVLASHVDLRQLRGRWKLEVLARALDQGFDKETRLDHGVVEDSSSHHEELGNCLMFILSPSLIMEHFNPTLDASRVKAGRLGQGVNHDCKLFGDCAPDLLFDHVEHVLAEALLRDGALPTAIGGAGVKLLEEIGDDLG